MRWAMIGMASLVAGCSSLSSLHVGWFSRTSIPTGIAPPANERLEMVLVATGVQIYRCDPKQDQAGQFEWVLQSPEATLRDVAGKHIGRHYAGPTWEAADGSKVVGTVQSRVDAPAFEKSIPWLRLSARSTGSAGVLSKMTTVLRVGTRGGLAPAGCGEDDRGKILRVDYRADYNFYAPK